MVPLVKVTMPDSLSPMKIKNNPKPEVNASFSVLGSEFASQGLIFSRVNTKSKRALKNIAVTTLCHLKPSVRTTV